MLTQMVGPVVMTTPFVIGNFPEITPEIAILTFISAVGSMIGNVLMLLTYKMQEATNLAPFVYFQLTTAVVLGWLVFDQLPQMLTIVGMVLIIVAGSAGAMVQSRRPVTAGA